LIDAAHDRQIWSHSYEQEIKETRDIFIIQSQIAHAIALELQAIITPQEKLLIEKIPTTSLTAHDFYQRGREEHIKYLTNGNISELKKARNLYHKSLEYDSFRFLYRYFGKPIRIL
jgi:hypothetical protein